MVEEGISEVEKGLNCGEEIADYGQMREQKEQEMSEIRYYKGKYEVKVLMRNRRNWTVETLEEFQDYVHGERCMHEVKSGTQLNVAPNLLFKKKGLPPPLKEHIYELKMEKRLKHLIAEEEKKKE